MRVDRRFVLVLVAATALGLAGLGHGIFRHGDEARFVVAARDILRGGPWLIPTTFGEPMLIKPPLFVWLIAMAGKAHGRLNEFTARLPGALSGIVAAGAVYLLGARLFGKQVALLAALLFSTTFGAFLLSREVLPDMPMTAAATLAMLAAVVAGQDRRRRAAVGFAAALALAFHFKLLAGLIPPVVTVVLVAWLRRDLQWIRSLRPVLGVLVFFALLLPWLVRIVLVPDFLTLIDTETFRGRAWSSWHSVYSSPLRALEVLVETVFPWVLLVPLAAVHLWRRRAELRQDPILVPLVWLAVVVALNMAIHTVRWRYLLPGLPPAALVMAWAWSAETEHGRGRLGRWLSLGPLAALFLLFTSLGGVMLARAEIGLWGRALTEASSTVAGMLAAALWIVGGLVGLSLLERRPRWAMPLCVALVVLSLPTIELLTRAERDRPQDPRPFASLARAAAGGSTILVNSDSVRLNFYLAPPTIRLREGALAQALAWPTGELIIVPADRLQALQRRGALPASVSVLQEGRYGDDHLLLVRGHLAVDRTGGIPER